MAKNINCITGDKIKSKVNSESYRDNWDKVFGSKEPVINIEIPEDSEVNLEEVISPKINVIIQKDWKD